jgi:hypothetical protein
MKSGNSRDSDRRVTPTGDLHHQRGEFDEWDQHEEWVTRRRQPRSPELDEDKELEIWPGRQLLSLLDGIDHHRTQLTHNQQQLARLLHRYPALRQQWDKFIQLGDSSAHDFRRFQAGTLRPRIAPQYRHLRLGVNRRHRPVVIGGSEGSDPDAA